MMKIAPVLKTLLIIAAAWLDAAIPNNMWTTMNPGGIAPKFLCWETMLYVSSIDRCVAYADYKAFSTESQHTLIGYDYKTNRWAILDNSGYWGSDYLPGGGHDFSRAAVDQMQGVVLLPRITTTIYGRYASNYDVLARCGREMNGPGQYGPFTNDAANPIWDSKRKVIVAVSNKDASGAFSAYDPATRQARSFAAPANISTNLRYSRLMYDPRSDRYFLLGSLGGFWSCNPDTYAWTPLTSPSGTAYSGPQAVYDDKYGVILYFKRSGSTLNGLAVYDPVANTWTDETMNGQVASQDWGGSPLPYYSSWTAYDIANDVVITIASGTITYAFKYAPAGRTALTPLPVYTYARITPSVRDTNGWSSAQILNRVDSHAVLGTSLSAGGSKVYLSWTEDQGELGVREWNGTAWSSAVALATSGAYFPNLTVRADDKAAIAAYSIGWNGTTLKIYDKPTSGNWAVDTTSVTRMMNNQFCLDYGNSYPCGNAAGTAGIKDPVACYAGNSLYVATPFLKNGWMVFWKRDSTGNWSQASAGPVTREDMGRLSMIAVNSDIYLAWDERLSTGTEHVLVKKWDGVTWTAVGGPLNVNSADRATKPCLAATSDGTLYCAFIERTVTGNILGNDRLYVRRWSGSTWETVGAGSLNKFGEEGNAWSPALVASGMDVWVAWAEYRPARAIDSVNSIVKFDRPQVNTARLVDGEWISEGTSLNADPVNGSAGYVSLTVLDSALFLGWAEAGNISDPRQVLVRTKPFVPGAALEYPPPDSRKFALYPNLPNPFNPRTVIRYSLPQGNERMQLKVFDLNGRLVRTLKDEQGKAGHYSLEWNGRDDNGAWVASGIYFYRLKQGGRIVERKMILAQ